MKDMRKRAGIVALVLCICAAVVVSIVCGLKPWKQGGKPHVFYTLSFYSQDGVRFASVSGEEGDAVSVPVPEREGFVFEGWYSDPACIERAEIPANFPSINQTFYAKFSPLFLVKFMADGKELHTVSAKAGAVIAPPEATKEGYTFLGWESGQSLVKESFSVPEENVTLTARFGKNPVLVFYANAPAGERCEGETQPVAGKYGEETTVPVINGYRTETYRFAGWATSPDGRVLCSDGELFSFSEDCALYAQWAYGYTNARDSGKVFYTDRAADRALFTNGREEARASVAQNRLGEREFTFEREGKTVAGKLCEDGTFVYRDELYGDYALSDGAFLFLSGYGTALYRSGQESERGVYDFNEEILCFRGRKTLEFDRAAGLSPVTFHTFDCGNYTVEARVNGEPRVLTVSVKDSSGAELGEAELRDGTWILSREYVICEISVVCSPALTATVSERDRIFTAKGEDAEFDYTLYAAGRLKEVRAVRVRGVSAESGEVTELAGGGYGIRVSGEREEYWVLNPNREAEVFRAEKTDVPLGNFRFYMLCFGERYAFLPQAARGDARLAGNWTRDGDVWEWRFQNGYEGLAVTLAVDGSGEAPYAVRAENVPQTVRAENGAEAEIYLKERGGIGVSFFSEGNTETAFAEENLFPLGENRWYLACGYMLTREDGFRLEPCGTVAMQSGGYRAEFAKISDLEIVPVRFWKNGTEKRNGALTERDDGVWLWQFGEETYTLARTEDALTVFEGEQELFLLTFALDGERVYRYAAAGDILLPAFERAGYRLVWTARGTGTEYDAGATYRVRGAATFTGRWEEVRSITFCESVGGEIIAVVPVENGRAKAPEITEWKGKTLDYWCVVEDGELGLEFDEEFCEDVYLVVAVWKE